MCKARFEQPHDFHHSYPTVPGIFLTSFNLASNKIGDEGAIALAGSPHLANPIGLDLSGNPIGPRGVEALRRSFDRGRLRSLRLTG